jgi:hypothetical protein
MTGCLGKGEEDANGIGCRLQIALRPPSSCVDSDMTDVTRTGHPRHKEKECSTALHETDTKRVKFEIYLFAKTIINGKKDKDKVCSSLMTTSTNVTISVRGPAVLGQWSDGEFHNLKMS